MPLSPPLSKRRKAVKTYGRASRSKLDSFKVFQDVIGDEGAGKKSRKHSEGYGRPSYTTTLVPPPIAEKKAFSSRSSDIMGAVEDPFADPIDSTLESSPPVPQRGYSRNTTAPHYDKGSLPRAEILTEKSTNHPVLLRSTALAGVPYTPRPIIGAKPPQRPRKYRGTGPALEDQDFPTVLSPSKARNPDSKNRFRGYSGFSGKGLDRPYNEPPTLLGVTSADMSDSISTTSRTWVREKAKGILSGTKKAAEKILSAAPSSTRYRSQHYEGEINKLKGMRKIETKRSFDVVISSKKPKRMGHRVLCNPETNGDIVSLQDFLQDPFSHPKDYKNYHSIDRGGEEGEEEGEEEEEGGDPLRSNKIHGPRDLWRSESTQDLLILGSAKMQNPIKEIPYGSRYRTEDEDLSSFLATTNLSPGSAYDFTCPQSDNEMPSSSPIFKSTPKKEWYLSKAGTKKLSFGTDFIEDMAMEEHLGDDDGSICDGRSRSGSPGKLSTGDTASGAWGYQPEINTATRPIKKRYPILRAAASEDELYDAPYDEEISKAGSAGNRKGHVGVSTDGSPDSKEGKRTVSAVNVTKINDGNFGEGANQWENNIKGLIHVGGSRTSKRVSKGSKHRKTVADTRGVISGGINRATANRVFPKKNSSGGIDRGLVKKEIRRRRPSKGYEQIKMDDGGIDELQMDLPEMMV